MIPGWEKFLDEIGGVECANIRFRPGAPASDPFGLTCRYRMIGGAAVWGFPSIHWGCDRGGSDDRTVYAPLRAESSDFVDHGDADTYGSEVVLRHWGGFVVRIAHMRPDRVLPIARLKACEQIEAGLPLGPIGDYGLALGAHTHVEIESVGESCPLLEALLLERWGEASMLDLPLDAVLAEYAECDKTRTWVTDECLRDWFEVRGAKGVSGVANKYLIRRTWGRSVPGMHRTTVYSSILTLDF